MTYFSAVKPSENLTLGSIDRSLLSSILRAKTLIGSCFGITASITTKSGGHHEADKSRFDTRRIAAAAFSLAACDIVASPMRGTTFNETKYGNIATAESDTTKEGKACGTSILGGVAQGDASIAAAKAAGGITKVTSVDHTPRVSWGSTANGARSSRATDSRTSAIEGAFGVEAPEALLFWSALLANAV